MTVAASLPTVTYQGNNATTVFSFSFLIPYQSDGITPAVQVSVLDTTVTPNVLSVLSSSLYTIAGVGVAGGGTVTYPLVGPPLAPGYQLTIARNLAYNQPNSFPNYKFLPVDVEAGLDYLELQIQQLRGMLGPIGTPSLPPPIAAGFIVLTPSGGDDGPILAGLSSPAYLTGGQFQVNSSQTTSQFLNVVPGATINTAPGQTLTMNGQLNAPRVPVFTGAGNVVLKGNLVAYPEWWGAQAGVPTLDCGPPINASIAACTTTQLGQGAYYLQTPVNIQQSSRKLIGNGPTQTCCPVLPESPGNGQIDPNATQLVITSNNGYGIIVGPIVLNKPANLIANVFVESLTIARATPSAPYGVAGVTAIANPTTGFQAIPGSANQASSQIPIGLICCWGSLCHFKDVYTTEHSMGFYIYGMVESFWDNCRGLRYSPGGNIVTPNSDFVNGIFMDNSAPSGYNSGNASLYFNRCQFFSNWGTSGAPNYSYTGGIQSYAGFTDTYITQLETGGTAYGIDMRGRQQSEPDWQSEDLIIRGCVLDSIIFAGINIQNAGPSTAVQIVDCYVGMSGAPSATGIYLQEVHGSVGVKNCQVIGSPGVANFGLAATSCSGIKASGNIYTDIGTSVWINAAYNVYVSDSINQTTVRATQGVLINSLNCGKIDCQIYISGSDAGYNSGVNFADNGSSFVEVDLTQIRGATHQIMNNGAPVTAAGNFGNSSLATGIWYS